MMKHTALSLILGGILALSTAAQTLLKDGKIPEDLVITLSLSSTIQFSSQYSYRITTDGKVYFEDHSNSLPLQKSFAAILGNVPGKIKWKKPKSPKLKD